MLWRAVLLLSPALVRSWMRGREREAKPKSLQLCSLLYPGVLAYLSRGLCKSAWKESGNYVKYEVL